MRVEANELRGTDVKLVSLVKRGANRLPWRITKEDNEPMLDITKYFRKSDPSANLAPALHSAILRKDSKKKPAFLKNLKKAGIDISHPVEKGDLIIFAQKMGEPASDAVLIKSNDDVGFVVENLSKAFSGYDFSSNDFNDVFSTGSFCPSVAMASDLLGVTIGNILSASESPSDASAKIAKAVDGFKQYSVTLANSLPVQAFKADQFMKAEDKYGSTSMNATTDDANNTRVNDIKPDKSLADSEGMKGVTDGMKRPNTNAGSTSISDAIDPGTVDSKLGGPTVPAATDDDKKAVFQGNKVSGKGGKNAGIPTQKAERLRKEAAECAASGDHETATILYKTADKLLKAGGQDADTQANEGTDNSALNKLRENQSGAGAQSSNSGANVSKSDPIAFGQITSVVATLRKSADEYEKVGLKKRADAVRAQADRILKDASDGDPGNSMMTNGNGTSLQATEDDANNTAVGATKKKPDPNLSNPDHLDANGWSAKIAHELAEVTKAVTSAIGDVRKEVAGLAAQVTSINGRIAKTEEAVNGTVYSEPGRDMLGFRAQKAEVSGEIPTLDTGLQKYDREPTITEIREYASRRSRM